MGYKKIQWLQGKNGSKLLKHFVKIQESVNKSTMIIKLDPMIFDVGSDTDSLSSFGSKSLEIEDEYIVYDKSCDQID